MDSLFLLQFACFIFMLINAFIVALSHLHVRWENKRYERSRWMIVAALIGLAIQYVLQMTFGFRAMHDNLGAVINILLYTPCFSLISIGIYNIETTRANLRKMILMCSGIYAAIIVVFCVGINLHHSLYIREGLYLMLTLFCVSVFYCIYMIIQEMIRRKNMLETMAATDLLPYVRYSRASLTRPFYDVPFESEESFAYIMLPQNLESNKMDIEIYLLLNDSEVKYTTPITPSTNGQLEGGKKYTYNITVKNTGITIEDAHIYPWENGDSSDLDADIAL